MLYQLPENTSLLRRIHHPYTERLRAQQQRDQRIKRARDLLVVAVVLSILTLTLYLRLIH